MSAPQGERGRVARLLYDAMATPAVKYLLVSWDVMRGAPGTYDHNTRELYLQGADAVLAYIRERDVLAVEAMEARIEAAEARAEEAEKNAAFLRESVGECHLMISKLRLRQGPAAYYVRQNWDAISLPARLLAILKDRQQASERIIELEGALLGAGRLYGFECADGLPCWCEPEERQSTHSERCTELRALLAPPRDEAAR